MFLLLFSSLFSSYCFINSVKIPIRKNLKHNMENNSNKYFATKKNKLRHAIKERENRNFNARMHIAELLQISFSKFSYDLHSQNVCAYKIFTSENNSKIVEFMYSLGYKIDAQYFWRLIILTHYHRLDI